MDVNQLLGPYGLTVALAVAVIYLGRVLLRFVQEYIDELEAKLDEAVKGWQAQTEANRILADAQAARNRDDEMRHRLGDKQGRGS